MAHSCRWRFPARPGTGRRLGARHRVAALLKEDALASTSTSGSSENTGVAQGATVAPGGPGIYMGVGLGFDAALQVSVAIGSNLRRFRDVSGGSSGEEDAFLGFGPDEDSKIRTPSKFPADQSTPRKPRGRPRCSLSRTSEISSQPAEAQSHVSSKQDLRLTNKAKRPESISEERRRGRPPAHASVKLKVTQEDINETEPAKTPREEKLKRRKPSAVFKHAAKLKKLRAVKLSPLKPKFKSNKLQLGRKGAVQIVRRRGRPPSSDRFKTVQPGIILRQTQQEKSQKARKEDPLQSSKEAVRISVRQSPRRIKPVRIIPTSKRTDTTIAKQLLQKAKKGAQKKMGLEAAKLQGRKGGTQLKNIRQFIMPVVSTVSSRIIKTPRRFIEDEDYEPPIKIPRMETAPSGRFSLASCESSEKSSAVSQQSSQATSDDSRSSSPSIDTSTESQVSEEMTAITEASDRVTEIPLSTSQSTLESSGGGGKRNRRVPNCNKNVTSRQTRKIAQPDLQQASVSPPPPLLSPPAPLQASSALSEQPSWLMPPAISMATHFLSGSRMHEKRRSILREPTFRWTSLKHSRLESQYFSSAKYAKEGLIRKPIFDNFRPPPLTPEDVGLASASRFNASVVAPGRLFSPLHTSGARFDVHKRSPILRAPRFTPSEAHSRIFESVTLPPSLDPSGGSSSILGISSRRRKRRVFSPIGSSEPRSPSHSMRTRSRRENSNSVAPLIPQSSSSLASLAVSSRATSALSPSFTFSSTSISAEPGESAEKYPKTRKQASTSGEPFSSSSNSSLLFPWFVSSSQSERKKNNSRVSDEAHKEKDSEKCREKEREKENSHDVRKDRRKKSSGSLSKICKDRVDGEAIIPIMPIKILSKKKQMVAEPSVVTSPPSITAESVSSKNKFSKKIRGIADKHDVESSAKSPAREIQTPFPEQPESPVKSPTTASTIGSVLDQANKFLVSEKHMATLLRTAKCQLQNIEKSKLRKQTEPPKVQGQESDSSETSIRGPRIKHVCRRAAVALGRKRAVFPDDMPTLSALPWEEREKVLSSMGNDDKSSIAGSEDTDPPPPPIKPIKQVIRSKILQEPPVKKGRRSRRCGQCSGCQVPEDCGICTNCLDKPKFGGRNIKKQCCKMRKCQNLQWMPSKAFLQKQAKAAKKKEKKAKLMDKQEAPVVKTSTEPPLKTLVVPTASATPPREVLPSASPPALKKTDPPRNTAEEKVEEESPSAPAPEIKQSPSLQKATKPLPPQSLTNSNLSQGSPSPVSRKEPPKITCEVKKKQPSALPEIGSELNKYKKLPGRLSVLPRSKSKEKDKPLAPSKPESNFNLLNSLYNISTSKQKLRSDGIHRIRVDFKEDCDLGNVWEMGGLSILTTVPITPRVLCFVCASSGNVEFVYCQVCCEPFHRFCLEEKERPTEDQLENWCCRQCKFCHVCGRQQQVNKPLLECNKCRNSYHPECLGPNYPTKPTKKKRVWICTKCVRCKSCGSTTPGKGWDAQWSHDFSLCHDCAKLFAKGNFCPLCNKCYDDDDYESKMMQCGKCDRWVHSKCENLTDEMYEILSNLPESVAYTCVNCTEHHPAEWRLALINELQASLRYVLNALLNSRTASHLLRYRQAAKPPDLNPEPEENMPSRSSPEGPDPPILTQVGKQDDQPPLDLEGVKKKMDQGRYTSVLDLSDDIVRIIQAAMNADGGQPELKKANGVVKSFFTRQMERVFPWFNVKKSRFWEPNKVNSNNSMLPNAVLPPSLDHNYAQWQERENGLAMQPTLVKKIIPAPKPRLPEDPVSPQPGHSPVLPSVDHSIDDGQEILPPPGVEDNRQCALCLKFGDDIANDAGRLLYIGQDEWTHVNCALWSAEVFEDDDGSLKNVHMAVIRGKQLRCEHCLKLGATVGCCLSSCTSNYHFMCSRLKSCVFLDDKKVYCQKHRDLIKGEIVSDNNFEVLRRVFVDFEGINLRRKYLNGLEPDNIHIMIGSMTVDCLGILSDLSDCEEKLFPIGYQCSRVYWSTTDARKRCVYTCKILECRPPPTEPDVNRTVPHEENRTIAHSPPQSETYDLNFQQVPSSGGLPSPEPLSCNSASSPLKCSQAPGGNRSRHRYLNSPRSPGPRPLPSAGSPVTHEIVTVGDPLLSSGLRSIGSRRHSASSVSPLPKPRLGSLSQSDTAQPNVSPEDIVDQMDHGPSNMDSGGAASVVQNSCSASNGYRISVAKGDRLIETRQSKHSDALTKVTSPKIEKVKSYAPRISELSTNQASNKIPHKSQDIFTPDCSMEKIGTIMDVSYVSKTATSTNLHRAIKRENDQHVTLSPTSSEESKEACIPVSVTKERRPKSKNLITENVPEKNSGSPITDSKKLSGESQNQADSNGQHLHLETSSLKGYSKKLNSEKIGPTSVSLQLECTDGERSSDKNLEQGLSPCHIAELPDASKPQICPKDTGDHVANHRNSDPDPEPQTCTAYPHESNLLLQDGTKTQEGNSYKRRYPRRSARARSNMFFGLTPLYGVRSYGEEDLPFCSSTPGKKRGKRSAEGQVDGADDLSSSEDDDIYYYNFSRTVVPASGDQRLTMRSLFNDDGDRHTIAQLDGVDDGTESDASISTTSGKSSHSGKRSSKQNGAGKLVAPEEQLEKGHAGKSSKVSDTKLDSCHSVKQDSLEPQLGLEGSRRNHSGADKNLLDTFSSELLKSDSDNNNSDDCGNILPIDIMDFVLKNTPSMQALGESPESSSSELLTLGEGLGLDNNRGKDMGLFEVFSQQIPSSEPVDGTVSSTMSAEEQFELPLELPSDLSVLTTRSPSIPNQSHGRLGVIPESPLSPSERSLLSLPASETSEKRVTVTEKPAAPREQDSSVLAQGVERTSESHITAERYIPGRMESEHISSPSCGQVDHTVSLERRQNSSAPNLQVPSSPTVPVKNQKYTPSTSESTGTSQMSSSSIQSTPPHLKSTEKLVVVNQNMQPLYVLQPLTGTVTQKIQLTPSVPSGSSRIDGDVSVIGPVGGGLTLTTNLSPPLTSAFPPVSKALLPVSHHPQLQHFPAAPQTTFLPGLTNQSPGLLIGVQPSPEPQLIVSESNQRLDLSHSSNPPPGMNKKRLISRLHSKKNKKLAPSVTPGSQHATEVISNMTLINFSAPQLASSLPNHPNLIELGSLGNTAPHRNIPNIIKRSKSGVMYFDQTPLLPQSGGAPSSGEAVPSIIGLDPGQLSGKVPAIATGSPVINVLSMQTTAAVPSVSGHVTLTSPGILSSSEIGPISNFLIKANSQGLGIQDNHIGLPPGSGIFSQGPTTGAMTTTSSICVVPTSQPVGVTLAQTVNDPDCLFPVPHNMNRLILPPILPDIASNLDHRPSSIQSLSDSQDRVAKPSTASSVGMIGTSLSANQRAKSKGKRQTIVTDKISKKKIKMSRSSKNTAVALDGKKSSKPSNTAFTGSFGSKTDGCNGKTPVLLQVIEDEKTIGPLPAVVDLELPVKEQTQSESKPDDSKPPEDDVEFSSPLMRLLQHEQRQQDALQEPKPRTGLLFEISSDDGFQISANSIEEAWKFLTDKVQEARSNARLKQLSFAGVNGLRMLGIIHDAIVFLVEQLYGASKCHSYKFRFHRPPGEEEPPLNPHGSARAEVYLRKSTFDMFNFLASKHRQPPDYKPNEEDEEEVQLKSVRRATSMDLPMPMRFRHLKKTSKEAVGVYRSPIHGRGLFCKRTIDAGEMVIEYSGNVIRSTLTDKREKYYDGKGIGCYMFRIDDAEVVDATMHGNAARFINHSCEPNCYSRVIPIDGQKHIVIFAMRKIYRGEELTYDYKFPIEDASNKLACNCGTKKCRKFLN